jgi:hypothetical protein
MLAHEGVVELYVTACLFTVASSIFTNIYAIYICISSACGVYSEIFLTVIK